jgi:hypothetical protein
LGLAGDGSFVGGTEAGVVQDTLELGDQYIADLLLRTKKLLVRRVDVGELLIGELGQRAHECGDRVLVQLEKRTADVVRGCPKKAKRSDQVGTYFSTRESVPHYKILPGEMCNFFPKS